MKRLLLLPFLFIISSVTFAQTQQGIVKTPTRRNVNGTMTQGQYIPNATVAILLANNNTKQSHVSGNQGKFSFYAPSPYYITSVTAQKGSYTFLDADFSKKQRQYSKNVVEVLVDDPNVLAKVRDEAIAYERSKIRKQIRAKEDEIGALKEANKITTAEYNKMIGELSEYRKSSEAIVQQIAEVYATTDFDKMDDFNKKLLAFVEEGNFKSADSLLRTQGSKEELFEKIKKEEQAIRKTEEDVNRAKEYNNQEKEALALRLYSEHLMYLQKPLMQDSARYCLKMRADLDTTNVSWSDSYADLCRRMHIYDEAIKYYKIGAENALQQGREDLSVSMLSLVALIYDEREQFDEEYKLLTNLIHRGDSINKSNLAGYKGIDFLYWNLANYYRRMNQFDKAVECLKKCNDINRGSRRYTEVEKKYGRVESLSAIGSLYANMFMPNEALPYLLQSRELLDSIYANYPNNRDRRYEHGVETSLGIVYERLQEYDKALFHYQLSYNIQKDLYKINPEAILPFIAEICKNIGFAYFNLGDLDNSIKYMEESLVFFEEQHQKDAHLNALGYCDILNNIGYLSYLKGNYTKADEFYAKSASILHPLYEKYPSAYAYNYVLILINQFSVYRAQNNIDKCGTMLEETENLAEKVQKQRPGVFTSSILIMYKEFARYYMLVGDKDKAEFYINKIELVSPEDPDIPKLVNELEQTK